MLVLNASEINNSLLVDNNTAITIDFSVSSTLKFVSDQVLKPIVVTLINAANIELTVDVIPKVIQFLENFLGQLNNDQIELLSEGCGDRYTVFSTVGDILSDGYNDCPSIISNRQKNTV